MTSVQNYGTRSNPITQKGRVVFNAQSDFLEVHTRKRPSSSNQKLYSNTCLDDACFSIQPGEVCVMNTHRRPKAHINDSDVQVLSSANGLALYAAERPKGVNFNASDPDYYENCRKTKRRKLTFGGVADNRATYDSNNLMAHENNFASVFGGLKTITNTGLDEIRPGDLVCWDLPKKDETYPKMSGVPRNKQLITVQKYNPEESSFTSKMFKGYGQQSNGDYDLTGFDKSPDEMKQAAHWLKVMLGGNQQYKDFLGNDTKKNAFDNFCKLHMSVSHEHKSRIIGKAMSGAREGKDFDILLGHYSA